jgi:hypothetical protein
MLLIVKRTRLLTTICIVALATTLNVHGLSRLADSVLWKVETQATLANGDNAPFWLAANRYGLSSLEPTNGYLRAAAEKPLLADSLRRWGCGWGLDVATATGFTSHVVLHQAFFEARWLRGVLTVGAKEQPMELKNQQLSSGSQALGINARPVPQVRLSIPDYWVVPGTKNWLALKGHIAYGRMTDDNWQQRFTNNWGHRTEGVMLHTKAGYLRIGPKNITLEAGLEMATQFGGKTYMRDANGTTIWENQGGLRGMVHALVPSGSDVVDGNYGNTDGNHLGSWVARFTLDQPAWQAAVYADHYFEDQSSMLLTGASGYGEGARWNERSRRDIFLYDLKDFMLGAEVKLKRIPWLNDVVVEYLTTRYQSGGVYHDHTPSNSTQITGRDDYYNHEQFNGWQHWGMVMGNPLYMSSLYNADGDIHVRNNRFKAWHLGLGGQPVEGLSYRFLATWQKGWGSYYYVFPDPKESVCLMLEAAYRFAPQSKWRGWNLKLALGMDRGKLYGDNTGVQLTISRIGHLF